MGGSTGRLPVVRTPPLLPEMKPSSSYSLLKFVYLTSQCNPLRRKILDPRLLLDLGLDGSGSTCCYLQVNALSGWIIGIYLHEFTNKARDISIPHEATECGIENFEFIVSERVQVNPDNSRAMSVLTFLLFKLNTLQTKIVKLWVCRSHGVMTVVYWIYTTAITPR